MTHKKVPIKKAEKAQEVILSTDSAVETLNKRGATVDKACQVLVDMLEADAITFDRYGVKHIYADHRVRHLGSLTVLEIHKVIKDKNISTSLAIFNDPTIVSDAQRVLKLQETSG